jgi:hypothetical protein
MFQFIIELFGTLGTGTSASPDVVGANPYQVLLKISAVPAPVFIGQAASIAAAKTLAAAVFATPNPSITWSGSTGQVVTSNVFTFQ